jgi:hypothetical protein
MLGDSQEAAASDLRSFGASVSANAHDAEFNGGDRSVSKHSLPGPDGMKDVRRVADYATTDEGSDTFETLTARPSTRGFDRRVDLFLRRVDGDGAVVFRVAPQSDRTCPPPQTRYPALGARMVEFGSSTATSAT